MNKYALFLCIVLCTSNAFACFYDLECPWRQVCVKKPVKFYGLCQKVSKK